METKRCLTDYFDVQCAQKIASQIVFVHSSFPKEQFVAHISSQLKEKMLLARQDVFAQALEVFLPFSYEKNLLLLNKILGHPLPTESGMFTYGYWLWPIGRYVERNALLAPDETVQFVHALTQRFTGEFALRPLITHQPEYLLRALSSWVIDESVHVRRCASECVRIRLPWAKKQRSVLQHQHLYFSLLLSLKHDSSRFVQKSVANNINDLYKEDTSLAQKLVASFNKDASKHTQWIIRHGSRWYRKQQAAGGL